MRTVLLLGATGLVGREVLSLLLDDGDVGRVVVVARRPTGAAQPKLDEHVFDLGEMEQHAGVFAVDQIVCALGTTIKQAGSRERFRVVDHDYPLIAARLGKANGARHYLLVSALGASAESRVFYNRVKGEVERDIIALGYRSTTIARPSLLLGDRGELRMGEKIAEKFAWLAPPKYKPIAARDVAKALVRLASDDAPGVKVVESRELRLSYAR
ncbi:MAG TPA: NAD(P)H-binding protein [Thermoanaerobaculia bacterium]|nr:NAD(P)H-binding protein [Thermoanaerobaculia bacterium]